MIAQDPEVSRFEVILIEDTGTPAFRGMGLFEKIYRNVEGIRRVLTDSGRLEVASLDALRDNYLASILLENPWIADHCASNDLAAVSEPLRAVFTDETTTAEDFADPIRPYASKIGGGTVTVDHKGLVIVAGQDLIGGLSQRDGVDFEGDVNLGPLAMNHFSVDLTSG